ncbi:MAG TPA: SDR family NAD(P)-dependent oxidoreductase, partial [Ilumatobacteraceae bacterium]|nr:SDR family NAD(P)-dependent oxidoreductase [Ilumatobacteraceae bacterium]
MATSTDERGVVVVAGGLGGIGSAIVADLAEQGHRVIAADWRAADVGSWLEEMVSRFGDRVSFEEVDVTDETSTQGLAGRLAADGIDVP